MTIIFLVMGIFMLVGGIKKMFEKIDFMTRKETKNKYRGIIMNAAAKNKADADAINAIANTKGYSQYDTEALK
jgi:hypothetical protein